MTYKAINRIAAVPSFPGLRRFPEGRGFKQWTGDDSKALMKVLIIIFWLTGIPITILFYRSFSQLLLDMYLHKWSGP